MDGLFERFWTKRSKKKDVVEGQNPPKESMVKLGVCSMVIEPHVFEATLYTVRNKALTFLPPVGQHQVHEATGSPPTHTPPQFNPNNMNSAGHSTNFSTYHHHQQPSFNQPSPAPLAIREKTPETRKLQQGPVQTPAPQPAPSTSEQVVEQRVIYSENASANTAPPRSEPATNTDPVIQMLAARAATDNELKSLMKIVALGAATQDQLRVFQNHIDELNAIIKSQGRQSKSSTPANVPTNPPQPSSSFNMPSAPVPSPTPASQTWHQTPVPAPQQEPLSQYYSQPPAYIKSKGPNPSRGADLSAIAFDLHGGNGDRYLIPKNSIVEYLPGNTQVLLSFLITRDGSQAEGGKYKPGVQYYQPVTIRLSSHQPKTLEPIAKVVGPAEEARKHMLDTMSKMTLADEVHLVTRLPRAVEEGTREQEIHSVEPDEDEPRASYDAPHSLLPLR